MILARPFKAGFRGEPDILRRVSNAMKFGLILHAVATRRRFLTNRLPPALKGRAKIISTLRVDLVAATFEARPTRIENPPGAKLNHDGNWRS
jgi:hypothetical protein